MRDILEAQVQVDIHRFFVCDRDPFIGCLKSALEQPVRCIHPKDPVKVALEGREAPACQLCKLLHGYIEHVVALHEF